MPEVQAARVTVVSLNTRGVPVAGSCLPGRYAVIGEAVEAGHNQTRKALVRSVTRYRP